MGGRNLPRAAIFGVQRQAKTAALAAGGIDGAGCAPQSPLMVNVRILCTDLAGLRAQALGLAEAAGLTPDLRTLVPRSPWDRVSPGLWLSAHWAVHPNALEGKLPAVVMGAGGAGARVAAALRRPGVKVVAIQHPRMRLSRFDLVMAARHDGITGDNVIVTRTALHRVTPARLAAEKEVWAPRFAAFNRPLVAVLLGGSNGRYRFEAPLALELGIRERDGQGHRGGAGDYALAPDRARGGEDSARCTGARGGMDLGWRGGEPIFRHAGLRRRDHRDGGFGLHGFGSRGDVGSGDAGSVAGKSARIGAFMDGLVEDGRSRNFAGKLELWDCKPLDDTAIAAAEMRRRLGI